MRLRQQGQPGTLCGSVSVSSSCHFTCSHLSHCLFKYLDWLKCSFNSYGENELFVWISITPLSLFCQVSGSVCTAALHCELSHVNRLTWCDWMWLKCGVKYTFPVKITWHPSSSHSKADTQHHNWYYLLRRVINQPVRHFTFSSSLTVCYEMRSRCDVSFRPNQIGAVGCEWWNSIVLVRVGDLGGGMQVEGGGECFLSWLTQEDAGSRPLALKCPHVRTGPKIQMYPLRQRTFTL